VVAVVDTNCDPSDGDYVIPGNDDALRAIRLFASKISDSAAEGSQLMSDKQVTEMAAAVYTEPAAEVSEEAAAAESAPAEGAVEAGAEDISMEDVLGTGGRKQPAVVEEDEGEVPHQLETRTF
jgi:small subunit ribosomal protein S2